MAVTIDILKAKLSILIPQDSENPTEVSYLLLKD